MDHDGEVAWDDVERLVDHLVSHGADGIVVSGTTGETSTLTDAEKLQLIKVTKSVANGRAKVIQGGPSNETAHAIQLAKQSAEAGADAVMAVTPYYNKPTQAGLLTHFRMVADATDLPMIVYDIPGRAGVPVKRETIQRLAKHPNILAVKDAKGDLAEVSQVLNETDLLYYAGDDAMALPELAIGATGLIGVTANIAPQPYRTIIDAVNRGDLATATAEHKLLEPLAARPWPHLDAPRPPAPRRAGGVGGRDDRERHRQGAGPPRHRLFQLPPGSQRRRRWRSAEDCGHDALGVIPLRPRPPGHPAHPAVARPTGNYVKRNNRINSGAAAPARPRHDANHPAWRPR